MARRMVFVGLTPLGYRVVLTRNRWREIIRYKHPALAGHEEEVGSCLREPTLIRASAKDPKVHMYYRPSARGYVCVVVGGDDPTERFVVTAYFSKEMKKGQDLWTE